MRAVVLSALLAAAAAAEQERLPRILFLTESRGYVHEVVKRPGDWSHPCAEKRRGAAASGRFESVSTQDASTLTARELAACDAVVFYTTGELPLPERDALLAYVRRGGGFVGIHCATDTFYEWPEYGAMVGAYFDGHPWTQEVRVKVEDGWHPATKHLGDAFTIEDEIYQFRNWERGKVHVLLSLDVASVDLAAKGVKRGDGDFALAWCKRHGRGRVFYTALGHGMRAWMDERFLEHVLGGVAWAAAAPATDDEGFRTLLGPRRRDGWRMAGPGGFDVDADGVATARGGMGLWWHETEWRDFALKLEFRQTRVEDNSGVFVRFPDPGNDPWVAVKQGYEIQIAGAEPSKHSTGAVYDFQAASRVPLNPPGEWNEYEITCIGPRTWVRLNGALVNVFEGDRGLAGRIGLQNHDDKSPVSFRNVRVKALPDGAQGYHVLFDPFDADASAWKMCGPGYFAVKDGALVSDGGMGMLWHPREFGDFLLMLDWKVERPEDNSGVFVRFPDPGDDPWVAVKQGYEFQICDTAGPKHRTGSAYSFQDATAVPTHPAGEWNRYEILAQGHRYRVWINGVLANDFTGERGLRGHVGLQNHDPKSRVAFRDIRVVELK